MRIFILSTVLSIITTLSYSQDQWLVTAQMDTVYGKIYLEAGDPFKADEARVKDGKNKTNYKSYQTHFVHLGKNQDFEVLKIDQRYQFVQVDLKGKYLAQYLYKDVSLGPSANYALKILVNWKGDQFKVSNLTPRKKYAEYFEDCESVSEKIESGGFKKKDLDKIIAAYDACIEANNGQTESVKSIEPPALSDDMKSFISALKSKNLYEGDLLMMIDDINQKLTNQQSVPKYLQAAVLEQLGEDEALKARFMEIIK